MEIINVSGLEPNASGVVYCGPPFRAGWQVGALQHRYTEGKDSTREEGIAKFGDKLRGIVSGTIPIHNHNFPILMALEGLTPKSVLGCWCKPKECHCDVIPEVWKERIESLSSQVHRLKEFGFTLVGFWQKPTCYLRHFFRLFRHEDQCNALYAFVVNGKLMYLGQTRNGLRKRLTDYKNGNKSTNLKVRDRICNALDQGQKVEIYAWRDNGSQSYRGFPVNLASGLEDSLIYDLNPPWNVLGCISAQ